MNLKRAPLLIAASLAMTSTLAQTLKPEDQIELRQAAYMLMGYSFGGIAAMAQGKRPYNKDEAIRDADLLVQVAAVPKNFFGEGTDKGHDTRAKPEIWTRRAEFDEKMSKMLEEVAKLPAATRTGDLEAIKVQVKATGSACGGCHDEFRVKR
ncbi:MAG TPA: cytochrome c [Usitatibacter sp.]|nr:cytochrome c [Usitatibacter sp.]